MQRTALIFTPAARGKITRAVYSAAGEWSGRRGHIPVKINRSAPNLLNAGRLIAWRAQLRGKWYAGDAGTVVEALEAIEKKAAEKRSEC